MAVAALAAVAGFLYFFSVAPQQTGAGKFEWKLTELPETGEVPRTAIALTYRGSIFSAGEYEGNCFVIENSDWQLLEKELSGVICWWAGGGTEIGVFDEGGEYPVAKSGDVEEGSAEVQGFRGNFKEIFRLSPPPQG